MGTFSNLMKSLVNGSKVLENYTTQMHHASIRSLLKLPDDTPITDEIMEQYLNEKKKHRELQDRVHKARRGE